ARVERRAVEGDVPAAGSRLGDPVGRARLVTGRPHLLQADDVGRQPVEPGHHLVSALVPARLDERPAVELYHPEHVPHPPILPHLVRGRATEPGRGRAPGQRPGARRGPFWTARSDACAATPVAGEEAGHEEDEGDDEEPLEPLDEEPDASEEQGEDEEQYDESHGDLRGLVRRIAAMCCRPTYPRGVPPIPPRREPGRAA